MLGDPIRNAFAEWIVVKIPLDWGDRAIRLRDAVTQSLVVHPFRAEKPLIKCRHLNMLQPRFEEKVPPLHSEGDVIERVFYRPLHGVGQLGCDTLVGVKIEDPWV